MDTPLLAAVGTVATVWTVLFFAIWRWGPGPRRRSLRCPTKRVRAKVTIEQREGAFGSLRAADVTACSLFPDAPVTCDKECLTKL